MRPGLMAARTCLLASLAIFAAACASPTASPQRALSVSARATLVDGSRHAVPTRGQASLLVRRHNLFEHPEETETTVDAETTDWTEGRHSDLPGARLQVHTSAVAGMNLTCSFTMADAVDNVYYDGREVLVKGTASQGATTKTITVTPVAGAYLVVAGHHASGGDPCAAAAFLVSCNNGVTSSTAGWESYGSESPVDDSHKQGHGQGWSPPCESTAATTLAGAADVKRIWATADNYAAFRITLASSLSPAPPTPAPSTTPSSDFVLPVHNPENGVHVHMPAINPAPGATPLPTTPMPSPVREHQPLGSAPPKPIGSSHLAIPDLVG